MGWLNIITRASPPHAFDEILHYNACLMRVFISWSGDRSKTAALGLKSLLEGVFTEGVDVFISDSIEAGEAWSLRLNSEIEHSEFGVICLTTDNFQAPWLLFEAGAIAKKLGSVHVVPYLIDPPPAGAERSPLAQFQYVRATEEGTLRLVKSINGVRLNPLGDQRLEKSCRMWWGDLEQTLNGLSRAPEKDTAGQLRPERDLLEAILKKVELIALEQPGDGELKFPLTNGEMTHLLNLRHQPSLIYKRSGSLQKEMRHLRDLGLIKNKGGPIGKLPDTFQLDQHFELSDLGLQQLLYRFPPTEKSEAKA